MPICPKCSNPFQSRSFKVETRIERRFYARQISRANDCLDVLNAVDPFIYGDKCPLGLEMHGGTLCSVHAKLRGAYLVIEEIFAKTTISDLLERPACTIKDREGGLK